MSSEQSRRPSLGTRRQRRFMQPCRRRPRPCTNESVRAKLASCKPSSRKNYRNLICDSSPLLLTSPLRSVITLIIFSKF